MTIKERILQEIEQLSEDRLEKVWEFLQSLTDSQIPNASADETWQAYLESEREREEVYRHLANS